MHDHHDNDHGWTLESVIGARVLLGAGLISLLAGAVFFVKLSNDHNWIPPEVRVACGVLAGLVLLAGGAWRLGKERTLIAEGLTGLGASVLYLSLWAAFGPFHLLQLGVAFASMVAVSGVLALGAWARKSENVALAGLAGGYLTPILLYAGSLDRIALAAYLAVLSGVMLALAVRCGYRKVEIASFAAALLYAPAFAPSTSLGGVWTSNQSLTVATILFGEFALALFVAARRQAEVSIARLVLLALEVLAYAAVLEAELDWNAPVLAIADAAFAAVLLLAVTARVPAAMRSAYGWLGLGLLTRAIDAWGGGHALTAAIAIEGAGLYWAGTRNVVPWMRLGGFALIASAICGAAWHLLGDTQHVAVLNERTFAVGAVICAVLVVLHQLRTYGAALDRWEHDCGRIGLGAIVVLGAAALALDAFTATGNAWTPATQTIVSIGYSFGAGIVIALGFRFRSALARWLGIGLFAATIAKVFVVDLQSLGVVERVLSALVLGGVLVTIAGVYQVIILRERRAA